MVSGTVISGGVHFHRVDSQLYRVRLQKFGTLEWVRHPVRTSTSPSSVIESVRQGEPILTSNATWLTVLKKINITKDKEYQSEVQPCSSTKSGIRVIDLLLDDKENLMDIPGIDEKAAEDLINARAETSSITKFLDNGGFQILTEEIQFNIGLLARKELVLAFNKTKLDQNMLQYLERSIFGSCFDRWVKRRPIGRQEILICVLAVLNGSTHIGKKYIKLMKNTLTTGNNISSSQPQLEWKRFSAEVLALLPEKKMAPPELKTKVIANNTREVIDTKLKEKKTSLTGIKAKTKSVMPQLVWYKPTLVSKDKEVINNASLNIVTSGKCINAEKASKELNKPVSLTNEEILQKFAEDAALGWGETESESTDVEVLKATTQKEWVVTKENHCLEKSPEVCPSNEIFLELIDSDECISSDDGDEASGSTNIHSTAPNGSSDENMLAEDQRNLEQSKMLDQGSPIKSPKEKKQ